MSDLLQQANVWLEGQRHDKLTCTVCYVANGTVYDDLFATKGKTEFEQTETDNTLTLVTTTDFIFQSEDLPRTPREGDNIIERLNNIEYTYEVRAFGGTRCYSNDNYKLSTRVITVLINEKDDTPYPPVFTSSPVITGGTTVGEASTVTDGHVDGNPTPDVTRQWFRDGVAIPGETNITYTKVIADLGTTTTVVNFANNASGDAQSTSNGIYVGASPVFTSSPVITGTPQPGETITATHGTSTGTPVPTVSGEWYLDGVATGNTTLSYVVQSADIGKDVTFVDTAVNGISPDAVSTSNTLSIVSGFVGAMDAISKTPIAAYSYQQLYASGGIDTNTDVRVISTPYSIGYENNKFSGTDWDTATSNGANTAYGTLWNDQSTANIDALQTVESRQSTVDRNGTFTTSADDKFFESIVPVTTYSKFSLIINLKINNFSSFSVIASQYSNITSDRQFFIATQSDRFKFVAYVGGVAHTAQLNSGLGAMLGSGYNRLYVTYDSNIGVKLYYNNGIEIVLNSNFTGVIDSGPRPFVIANYYLGQSQSYIDYDTVIPFADTLTQQDVIDFETQFVSNM